MWCDTGTVPGIPISKKDIKQNSGHSKAGRIPFPRAIFLLLNDKVMMQ
jgi:hypothetical protein